MQINRLIAIVYILLNKKSVPARELANRLGVSTRTIYRDIDVLSAAGIPVYATQGMGGGIALMDHYALSKAALTRTEMESTLLALKTLEAIHYPDVQSVLEKMSAVFQKNASDWVEIDFSPWGGFAEEEEKFSTVKHAILACLTVAFDYISSENRRMRRIVEPLKLIFKGRAWYLWGYCRTRRDYRLFRLSRIKNLTLGTETFMRDIPQPVPAAVMPDDDGAPLLNLVLRFAPEALPRLYDDYDDNAIVYHDDGRYTVRAVLPEQEWLYGYLLAFGAMVEVVAPEDFRQKYRDRLQQMLALHEKG